MFVLFRNQQNAPDSLFDSLVSRRVSQNSLKTVLNLVYEMLLKCNSTPAQQKRKLKMIVYTTIT